MKKDNLKEQYRVNEQIRVREVRIVGDNVESMVVPTAKALQMGQTEGAISGLSIAVAGIMTVIIAPIFMNLFA